MECTRGEPERGRRWDIKVAARTPNLILVFLGLSFRKVTVCMWRIAVGYTADNRLWPCPRQKGCRQGERLLMVRF